MAKFSISIITLSLLAGILYYWGWLALLVVVLLGLSGLSVGYIIDKFYIQVPEKDVAVVFRSEAHSYSRFLPPGRHWLRPGMEKIVDSISTRPKAVKGECQAHTAGGITVQIKWQVTYSLNPMKIETGLQSNMARTLPNKSQNLLNTHVPNAIQHLLERYTTETLYQPGAQRRLERLLRDQIYERLRPYGFAISRVILLETNLPPRVRQAIEAAYERKLQAQVEAQVMAIRQQTIRAFTQQDIQRLLELEQLHVLEHKPGDAWVVFDSLKSQLQTQEPAPAWNILSKAGAGQ